MSKRSWVWGTLVVSAFGCSNAGPSESSESVAGRSDAVTLPCNSTAKVLDVQGDLHGLWTLAEVPSTGRRAIPQTLVTVNFDISTQAQSVAGSFVPVLANGSCGSTVAAVVSASLLPASIWGNTTTDAARPTLPAPYSVLTEEWIRGVPSIAGPIAAGSDITLSSFSVNTIARQPVGMIAGTQVNLTNGTLTGDVTYGSASTIPTSVTVSGNRSLQAFAVVGAFQNLRSISTLLGTRAASGTSTFSSGTLTLSGSKPLNTFKVTAAQISQTSTLKITVPTGASAVIQVDGSSVDLSNKGIVLTGATASKLLWNLPSARSLSINSIAIPGSVLAPQARVQFDGGSIAGTLVARSLMTKSGSSITYAPLNIGLVFDAATPSALVLTPATPLQRKCQYQFQLIAAASGFCLQNPPTVPFFVSDYPSTPAVRELSDVQHDPSLKNLRTFAVRQGVNVSVDEALTRYQGEIGISRVDLVASSVSGPSFSRKNQVDTDYQQYAQGYPVRGYGYMISTEGAYLRSAIGKVAPNLPTFADPQLTSATALQKALTALKITQLPWQLYPAKYSAPVGRLAINKSATSFRLVWVFDFAASGLGNPSSVAVDAASGVLASVEPGIQSATQWLASGATYVEPVSDLLIDTPFNGQQNFTAGKFRNVNNTEVTTLATGKLDDPGVFTASSGVSYDRLTGVMSGTRTYPLGPWLEPDVEPRNEGMASVMWGLERANAFMKTLNLVTANGPWTSIDGAKRQRVRLNGIPWVGFAKVSAFYAGYVSDEDDAQLFFTLDGPLTSVDADAVAHEYAHALVHNMGRPFGRKNNISAVGESGSIGEGISDFFAVASNNIAIALDADAVSVIEPHSLWHCLLQPVGNGILECLVNLKNPNDGLLKIASADPAGQPYFYLDTKANRYQGFPGITCTDDNDQCGAHLNSTIVSHWAYLTALGTAGVNSVPCGLTIKPLDSTDIDNSLRLTLTLALRASTKIKDSGAEFADFRDASIRVAKDLLAENIFTDPKQVQTVLLAWDAVGLPPGSSGWTSPSTSARPSDVLPVDGAENVDPWGPFVWSVTGNGQEGSSWDFQISDTADFKTILHHQEGITSRWEAEDWNPQRVYYQVALPPNNPGTFFWRVRPTPASNPNPLDPWKACYPIHSIIGTGDTPTVSDLAIHPDTLDADGVSAIPGQAIFTWTAPLYSPVSFDTTVSTKVTDPGCSVATPGSHSVFGNDVMFADPLLPKTDYWVGVRAVGPKDFSGKQTLSNCVSKRFHIGQLPKPTIVSPALVPYPLTFRFSDEVTFRFEGKGSPTKVRLDFKELDDKENCSSDIKFHKDVAYEPLGAGMVSSFGELTTIFPDGNPTGYCFTATSIVGTSESEPSVESRFIFTTSVTPLSPGLPYYDSASYAKPALLSPADSYGKSVTFTWTQDPRAYRYRLRVGRWERRTYPIQELSPKNCDGGFDCAKPPHIIYDDFVTGMGKTLPGIRADAGTDCDGPSCGRYIWTVWPVYEDPDHPGQDWLRQPKVAVKAFAYSSGPSKPIVVVDSPSAARMTSEQSGGILELDYSYATSGDIAFHVHYQYVPDQQFKVFDGNSNAQLAGPGDCPSQANGLVFNDVYNCDLPSWSLTPPPRTYTALPLGSTDFGRIRMPVWNSDHFTPNVPPGQAVGTPDLSGTPVSNETVTFRRQVCGSYEQICCFFAGNGTSQSDTPQEKCPISGTPLVEPSTNECICRGCGYPGTECCANTPCSDGSACGAGGKCPNSSGSGGSGGSSGSCTNSAPGTPSFVSTMTSYQASCAPNGGMVHVDAGIDVPTCSIAVDKMKDLAAKGQLACIGPSLYFGWNAASGASTYQVYVENKQTGGFTSKDLFVGSVFGDGSVNVKDGDEPQFYQIVVRGETGSGACLKKGDYAVAGIMVASKCPQIGQSP